MGARDRLAFPIGATVYLKSGGQAMTVVDQVGDGRVRVAWFTPYGPLDERAFPPGALTTTNPAEVHIGLAIEIGPGAPRV